MITEQQVKECLEKVLVPGVKRSLAHMNLVNEVSVASNKVTVTLASTSLDSQSQLFISNKVQSEIKAISGDSDITVTFTESKPADLNSIKHVIAVMSGKGGVGKSLVTGLTAIALRRQGYEVGILDADITGSSIPRMFGAYDRPNGSETGILPVVSKSGIELMSMNLLLPSEDSAVIWRGPLMAKAITQFWEEVLWGKLDYLLVDLPPGTADAPLTVLQTIPVSGIIIVYTPQDLVEMIVKKAVNMAQKMEKPVIGVVENMSYFYVPELDRKYEIFGESKGVSMAKATGAPLLGQLPIDPELAKLCDRGEVERYETEGVKDLGRLIASNMESAVK